MEKPGLVISKNVRKLWRLQTAEKYTTKNVGNAGYHVYTNDFSFKAYVDILGVIIYSKVDNYNKVDFYKLRNFCSLLQRFHYGI